MTKKSFIVRLLASGKKTMIHCSAVQICTETLQWNCQASMGAIKESLVPLGIGLDWVFAKAHSTAVQACILPKSSINHPPPGTHASKHTVDYQSLARTHSNEYHNRQAFKLESVLCGLPMQIFNIAIFHGDVALNSTK